MEMQLGAMKATPKVVSWGAQWVVSSVELNVASSVTMWAAALAIEYVPALGYPCIQYYW
jgi:hypothetical protein